MWMPNAVAAEADKRTLALTRYRLGDEDMFIPHQTEERRSVGAVVDQL